MSASVPPHPTALAQVLDRFPRLRALETTAIDVLARGLALIDLPAGAYAFTVGSPCQRYLFVLEGTVRIQHTAECGREIVLYRVGAGETCILTAASLLSHEDYAAEGVAETALRVATLERPAFDTLLATAAPFRSFVFETYATRLTRLMTLVEEVAFRRVDVRLAERLMTLRDSSGTVVATHQELAQELGSAREVVSRQLKEFERRGWITVSRGRITVRDGAALTTLAHEGGR